MSITRLVVFHFLSSILFIDEVMFEGGGSGKGSNKMGLMGGGNMSCQNKMFVVKGHVGSGSSTRPFTHATGHCSVSGGQW